MSFPVAREHKKSKLFSATQYISLTHTHTLAFIHPYLSLSFSFSFFFLILRHCPMSVFQQIKQFLRNSTNRSSTNSDDSEDTISQREAKKYEAVARLVEEEKLARQRLPSYAGLERYKLVDTLGE